MVHSSLLKKIYYQGVLTIRLFNTVIKLNQPSLVFLIDLLYS